MFHTKYVWYSMATNNNNVIKTNFLFSYKFTGFVTLLVAFLNIYFWLKNNIDVFFTGYIINPNATMKPLTSISFIILACIYFTKNKKHVYWLLITNIIIQFFQSIYIFLSSDSTTGFFAASSKITIVMFVLTSIAFYAIKFNKNKQILIVSNSIVYIISIFAITYYLLDARTLNAILGFETLSWNTSMLFFINSISLFEYQLIGKVSRFYYRILGKNKTHPSYFFPVFFLFPIIFIVSSSILMHLGFINKAQSIFIIILFLNITVLISMFLYSYKFMNFYTEISNKSKTLEVINDRFKALNKKLNEANYYLEDFASITSHNLREPIIALNQLCVYYEETVKKDLASIDEVKDMFQTNIQNLNLGLNALIQYHNFIKDINNKHPKESLISESIDNTFTQLEYLKPKGTTLKSKIDDNSSFPKSHIDNIFHNLFTNSFKFKKENEKLNIEITAYKTKDYYTIYYKDNGIGLDVETNKEELFKKGARFHKESGSSNGYGLYYLNLYVNKLNGKVRLFSKVDKGTAFKIKIAT
ncbi:ATP-binding protein [Corallibacter sp.]|uniref:ATP-binding protein n=1 Tax=Corallibacter sp. TaxID=2038084 RepID=UPI003AB8C0FF